MLNSLTLVTKVSQEFYSATTYSEDNEETYTIFEDIRLPLSAERLMHEQRHVMPNHIKYESSVIYSDGLIHKFDEFTIYSS